jgi:hypothetical protein
MDFDFEKAREDKLPEPPKEGMVVQDGMGNSDFIPNVPQSVIDVERNNQKSQGAFGGNVTGEPNPNPIPQPSEVQIEELKGLHNVLVIAQAGRQQSDIPSTELPYWDALAAYSKKYREVYGG